MGRKDGFADALLAWYDREGRDLPWRARPGAPLADPYHVLVSEVMLQQTTVAVVRQRFGRFIEQFPGVEALAEAEEPEVLAAWAGLGYYRRARSLHACVRALVSEHQGAFPGSEAALKALPGIGDYTAAAITSIAFGAPAVVVDGNIERVMARVFAIAAPLPGSKKEIKAAAALLSPQERPGDYAQALMDLGALVCRPKTADCLLCPVRSYCDIQGAGDPLALPVKAPKKAKKDVTGTIFVLLNEEGQVLCEDRPADGLFGGMLGLPGGGWDGRSLPSVSGSLQPAGSITHVLTHRKLHIDVMASKQTRDIGIAARGNQQEQWLPVSEAESRMPTLFKKALTRGINSVDGE